MELVEEIKIRTPKGMREEFERMAAERHLKLADIVREALREYVDARQGVKAEEVPS